MNTNEVMKNSKNFNISIFNSYSSLLNSCIKIALFASILTENS